MNPFHKRFWLVLAVLGGLTTACRREEKINPDPGVVSMPCFTGATPNNGRIIEGDYLVVYHAGATTQARLSPDRLAFHSGGVLLRNGIARTAVKSVFAGFQRGFVCRLSKEQADVLRQDKEVALIEPDRIVSIASCVAVVDTNTIAWGVHRTGYGDGTGRTAWIIDSGIDSTHADLEVDPRSRSFAEGQASVQDQSGHGTHVAGIIGAMNNRIGTLGVASGANLVALKVLDQLGEGRISAVVRALGYVGQHARRGDVVNMSLVGDTISQIMDREVSGIADKGIMFAIAAGNQAREASLISPSRVNHPNVFTVSAMDEADTWAGFSNFGNDVVDVAAPGVSILSTSLQGGYAYMSGTSIATPHVAGLLLLDGRNFAVNGTVKLDPDGVPDPIAHKR